MAAKEAGLVKMFTKGSSHSSVPFHCTVKMNVVAEIVSLFSLYDSHKI
jgi:hypothetical protein